MAFSLGNQDKLALMMTLFGSQRKLAEALGVSHQRVGRWLREGVPALMDPETGEQLKSAGIKQIPQEASHPINDLFQIYKDVCKSQARVDGTPYTPLLPVFLNRPEMRNGQPGLRIYAEETQYIRRDVRINYFAAIQRTEEFIQASVRSEINIFSYIGAGPKEASADATAYHTRKRTMRYQKAHFQNNAENIIQAGGRKMPVFTRYENISKGTSTARVIRNLEAKIERHNLHATKSADMWLFQMKSQPSKHETPRPKRRPVQRAKRL